MAFDRLSAIKSWSALCGFFCGRRLCQHPHPADSDSDEHRRRHCVLANRSQRCACQLQCDNSIQAVAEIMHCLFEDYRFFFLTPL